MLTNEEIEALSIDRMIFHVVRPDSEEPVFLAEMPPPQFADFFVKRVRDTLRGSSYDFNEGSAMPALVSAAVADGGDGFVDASRSLARRFKHKIRGDNRMSPGALMLLSLRAGTVRLAALIKFEHHPIIAYSLETKEGTDPKPLMESIIQNFSQDKKAMQKSVVIRLGSPGHSDPALRRHGVVVIDRSSTRYRDATQHFENFLDVRRSFQRKDLTRKMFDAAKATIEKHKDLVPPEVAKAPTRHLREAFERMEGFDCDRPEEILGAVARGLGENAQETLVKTFRRELANRAIETESFQFDRSGLPQRDYKRLAGKEGFHLWYRQEHEAKGVVNVDRQADGSATITIVTAQLVQDDETEALPKAIG